MSKNSVFEQIRQGLDASTILAITDSRGIIVYANDSFCQISKYSQEELIGRSHRIVNSGYHPKGFFKKMWETILSGKIWQGEICNRAKDGSYYWTFATILPLKEAKGSIAQYLAIRYDITAQKEQELNLNLLATLQSALLDKSLTLSEVQQETLRILLTENQAEWGFIGLLNQNHTGIKELQISDIWFNTKQSFDEQPTLTSLGVNLTVRDTTNLFGWSIDLSRPFIIQNGETSKYSLPPQVAHLKIKNYAVFPITLGNKKIGCLAIANSKLDLFTRRIFSFSLITNVVGQAIERVVIEIERKQHTQSIEIREQQLASFIKNLPISAVLIDKNEKILAISNEWIKSFDWINQNYENHFFWNYFEGTTTEWKSLVEEALKGRSLKSGEVHFTTRLGRPVWLEWTTRPWQYGEEIAGAILLVNNLTDQKELYQEFEQMRYKQLLTSKMASLGEIAGGVAHEINNPLTIISGISQQMLRYANSDRLTPEYIHKTAEKLQHTTDRIATIIKGLKAFARDGAKDPMNQYSVQQIIRDSLPYIEPKLNKHNIEWRWNPDNDFNIECRPVQLSQVIVNLVNNAADAIQNFNEKWIEVQVLAESRGVKILVTDSGKGIPKVIAEKIMDPFFTTKDIGKGTGLGLSISKSIVEAHSGIFYLDESSPNTSFVLRLPFTQTVRLTIENGREAIALHIAWKQRILDSIQTAATTQLMASDDPLLEWINTAPYIYNNDPLTDNLIETFQYIFEQTKIIFDMIHIGKRDFVIGELIHSQSTYNSLSRVLISNIISLEQNLAAKKQKAA